MSGKALARGRARPSRRAAFREMDGLRAGRGAAVTGILGLIELQQRHELARLELKNRKSALEFGNTGYGDLLDAEFKRLADEGLVAGGQYSVLQIAEVLARVGEHPVYGVDATVAKFAQDQAQQLPADEQRDALVLGQGHLVDHPRVSSDGAAQPALSPAVAEPGSAEPVEARP